METGEEEFSVPILDFIIPSQLTLSQPDVSAQLVPEIQSQPEYSVRSDSEMVSLRDIPSQPSSTGSQYRVIVPIPEVTEVYDIKVCSPCLEGNDTKIANSHCTICDEYYCNECTNFHKKFRITKEHELSIINNDNMNLSSNPIIESSENSLLVPTFSSNINTENSPSTLPIVSQNNQKAVACDDCEKVVNIKSMKQHKRSKKCQLKRKNDEELTNSTESINYKRRRI